MTEEVRGDTIDLMSGMSTSIEITMYFIVFTLLSIGVILANRVYGKNLDGGFKKVLNLTSITSYIFITNLAIFYGSSLLILEYAYTYDVVMIIGYVSTHAILYTLIIFMILYMVLSAFYLRFAMSYFGK